MSREKLTKRDIGAEIITGLRELRDSPASPKRYEFAPADLKSIREQYEMSQKQLADFLMISVRTLQKWEQGIRNPHGAARTLLRIMEREPRAVLRALHDRK